MKNDVKLGINKKKNQYFAILWNVFASRNGFLRKTTTAYLHVFGGADVRAKKTNLKLFQSGHRRRLRMNWCGRRRSPGSFILRDSAGRVWGPRGSARVGTPPRNPAIETLIQTSRHISTLRYYTFTYRYVYYVRREVCALIQGDSFPIGNPCRNFVRNRLLISLFFLVIVVSNDW